MKKILVLLSLILVLIIGFLYYQHKTETIECWWGVLYPNLSFIGFENEEDNTKISALDTDYMPSTTDTEEIQYKIAIVEWLNKLFSF